MLFYDKNELNSCSLTEQTRSRGILTSVWVLHTKPVQTHRPADVSTADVSAAQATELACVCVWNSPL